MFTSDLHGDRKKYERLFKMMEKEVPDGVFIGGDILPSGVNRIKDPKEFLDNFLSEELRKLEDSLEDKTKIFIIMGNDDPRIYEKYLKSMDKEGLLHYVHDRTERFDGFYVTGYNFVPPTPFRLKDWIQTHTGSRSYML